ncbi:hypothetical protein [Nocardiopsis listeri]|nr:hypothetical protein [Nocardiopsis listeri]
MASRRRVYGSLPGSLTPPDDGRCRAPLSADTVVTDRLRALGARLGR